MFKKYKPLAIWAGIILLFIGLSVIYFNPILKGYNLPQMDNTHSIGMSKELVDFEKETGKKSQWTQSMFGGMPAYQIRGDSSANIFSYINKYSRLGLPYHTVAIVFLYMLGFFLFMRTMKFNYWLSVIGAVAFAFGSYNFIIIIAGHITKAYAIALMAPVLAGVLYAYNKNRWVGAVITTVALGAQIAYNHIQITYYLALLILVMLIFKTYKSFVSKTIDSFIKTSLLLLAAAFLAIVPNMTNLWTTNEYSKESIRGKQDLVEESTQKKAKGLDPEYAFAWSYGKWETLTLLIPNVMGGASEAIGNKPELLENTNSQLKSVVAEQSQYWGGKPFTSGPNYAGAIICFLFVAALFFYKGEEKWWLLAGTILSVLLAWGKNLEWFNMFMFNYFPLYNKFRTVEMALVIASVTIPILALLGLRELIEKPEVIREKSTQFLIAFGLTGGVAMVLYLFPQMFSFMNEMELEAILSQKANNPQQAALFDLLIEELKASRMALLKADALRSFVFITLASGSLWFFSKEKFGAKYLLPGLLFLIVVDLWAVDKRYLNNDHFIPAHQVRNQFVMADVDREIKKDGELGYRVFNIQNPFNEVRTSYFHRSLGGYHGAKLQRYQDIINQYLSNDVAVIMQTLQTGGDIETVENYLAQMPAINMLNAKYIILHPNMAPVENRFANGAAWFVNSIEFVDTHKDEIDKLQEIDIANDALIHKEYAEIMQEYTFGSGSENDTIYPTEYSPNKIVYKSSLDNSRLALFSEIYYPKGWKAYINGEEQPIIKANYLLRSLAIPAGESEIMFVFKPKSFKIGQTVSAIGSVIVLMLILGVVFRKKIMELLGKSKDL